MSSLYSPAVRVNLTPNGPSRRQGLLPWDIPAESELVRAAILFDNGNDALRYFSPQFSPHVDVAL